MDTLFTMKPVLLFKVNNLMIIIQTGMNGAVKKTKKYVQKCGTEPW